MTRYVAVVESGSCFADGTLEVRRSCGHRHRTYEAAEKCGAKHYAARTVRGRLEANADWHGYTIHNQEGERATP